MLLLPRPQQVLEVSGPRPVGTDVRLLTGQLGVLHGALLADTHSSTGDFSADPHQRQR